MQATKHRGSIIAGGILLLVVGCIAVFLAMVCYGALKTSYVDGRRYSTPAELRKGLNNYIAQAELVGQGNRIRRAISSEFHIIPYGDYFLYGGIAAVAAGYWSLVTTRKRRKAQIAASERAIIAERERAGKHDEPDKPVALAEAKHALADERRRAQERGEGW